MSEDGVLASWRPGPVRDAVLAFLRAVPDIEPERRLACFDNDGTLWCERPSYVQLEFFLDVLRRRVREDPATGETPELAAVLAGDRAAVAEIGLPRIALALTGLFDGYAPDEFARQVREFLTRARHPTLGRPLHACTYAPMRELIDELRRRGFTIGVVTGGGTEFVRAVSQGLYGVPPEAVVGSMVTYDFLPAGEGTSPALVRGAHLLGDANEGVLKVTHIQTQLGRRPVLAAGNSGGDREMLEWTASGPGPTLALLVDHDDAEREMRYASTGETVTETEPITTVGARLGWTVVSMARDWATVFGDG